MGLLFLKPQTSLNALEWFDIFSLYINIVKFGLMKLVGGNALMEYKKG